MKNGLASKVALSGVLAGTAVSQTGCLALAAGAVGGWIVAEAANNAAQPAQQTNNYYVQQQSVAPEPRVKFLYNRVEWVEPSGLSLGQGRLAITDKSINWRSENDREVVSFPPYRIRSVSSEEGAGSLSDKISIYLWGEDGKVLLYLPSENNATSLQAELEKASRN